MNPSPAEPPQPVETYESLAKLIDYHLLEPTLSNEQIAEGCRIAREYGVRAVVARPCDVPLVTQWLAGSGVTVAAVAGYPHGTSTTAAKLYEARDHLKYGVREIEFVLNAALTISRSFQHIETELMQIARSCNETGTRLTVILNSRWLGDDHKIIVTKICRRVEAHGLSVDGSEGELNVFKPLLKDVLALKLASPVPALDEAVAAREAGYSSIATTEPAAILDAWRFRIAPPPVTPS
jgi:deoxyribose-phosphate aldolase